VAATWRFEGENFDKNRALVERVEAIAADKECTVAQLSLAGLLAQGKDVLPIPAPSASSGWRKIWRARCGTDAGRHRQHCRGGAVGAAAGTRHPAGG
jgi:hypothetical protein